MSSANAKPTGQSTFDSLQDELNDFVAETARRLQSLSQALSGQQVETMSVVAQGEPGLLHTEWSALAAHAEGNRDTVATPEASAHGSHEMNVASQANPTESDPLDRLAAMKKRLAARMENRDDRN